MKFLIIFLISFALGENKIQVIDPWIREVPPVSKMSAAFVKIKNPTSKTVRLIEVKSNLSDVAELHTHGMVDGVMKMRKVPFIKIPANGEVSLKPGGLHIMFIGLKKKTIDKAKHALEFIFSDGTIIKKEAVVR